MKTVTKLEIPISFDIAVLKEVRESVMKAGDFSIVDINRINLSDIYLLLNRVKAEMKTAYKLGLDQGMIEAMATLRKELELSNDNDNDRSES